MIRAIAATTLVLASLLAGGTGAAGIALGLTSDGTAFVKPVHGAWISQGFGCTDVRIEPPDAACAGGHWHSGIDLAAPTGAPVYATAAGVAHVFLSAYGFGLHVVIDHGSLTSLYGHLSSVAVADGAFVVAGQVIGAIGSSGNSTGPHLHFEIDRGGVAEDPRDVVALP